MADGLFREQKDTPHIERSHEQLDALKTVVEWLEENGHGADERKRYYGELHQCCYACKILDMCKSAST